MTDTVVSNLPKKTQQRLSHAQSVKKTQPNSFSYFEAAAVTRNPKPKPLPPSQQRSKSSTHKSGTSSLKSKSSSEKKSNQSPLSSMRGSMISLPETPQLKLTFNTIQGRRYLTTPGTYYFLPVDDDEADRLVILHFLLKYALKGNVVAPVSNTLKHSKAQVLDIGCGSGGTWILEMAAEFPSSEFYGIDIISSFPTTDKPTNAHFSQHNFLATLPFPDNSLDYVHMSNMLCLLSTKQLQKLLGEISRVLKPLGTVEIIDLDYRIQRPGPLSQSLLNEECKFNKMLDIA
ncbi:S-adenosyl-L-methionine-dependent methyltransferase [Cunninghamella echinulata]|nr:S-adenosyl-L-methionine-dependent methyltransferase [Cunninghamella echinulata]